MVAYRRNYIPGGLYFFTVTLKDRQHTWLTDHVDLLRLAYRQTCQNKPFETVAIVVMPDHLHALWQLPEDDDRYSMRWQSIKSKFTRLLKARLALTPNGKGEYGIWQRRFWEHTICDDDDLQQHIDYIHYNPVKHGYVDAVKDWPYSSFSRYVERGNLSKDWGTEPGASGHIFGE